VQTVDGKLYIFAGASRSGKTAKAVKEVKRNRRVIVWDPEDQWSKLPGFRRVTTRADLLQIVTTISGPCRVAYVAGGKLSDAFNFWAGCAYHWGRYHGPCAAVAEELADVSTPGKAPDKWGLLIRRGLKRGIDIFAISQRWAEADKTAIGNASMFYVFRQMGDDVPYMARKTRVPVEKLDGMKPLEFVTVDAHTGQVSGVQRLRF
jgi:hypothetical protein